MTYDHIQDGVVVSYSHSITSPYIRKLTRCGTPEVLLVDGIIDLGEQGKIVPRSYPTLPSAQKYSGNVIVGENSTAMEVVDKTAEELQADLLAIRRAKSALVQRIIDDKGMEKDYGDDMTSPSISARAYAGFPNRFQTECIRYGQWIAACWDAVYALENQYIAGNIGIPSDEAIIAALPSFEWDE